MIHYDNNQEVLRHTGVGRPGRARGSKNGQIDPNAVAMKYYKVVGEKAEDPNQAMAPTASNLKSNYASGNRNIPRQQVNNVPRLRNEQKAQVAAARSAATPSSFVERGKKFIDSALGTARTTANEVGRWANERSNDLNRAWNGYEIEGPKNNTDLGMIPRDDYKVGQGRNADVYYLEGKDNPTRVKGVKDNIVEGAQKAGQAVAGGLNAARSAVENVAKDAANIAGNVVDVVGKEADRIWNGQTTDQGEKERISGNYEPGAQETHTKGPRETIEDTLVDAGDQVKAWWEDLLDWGENAWNGVSNWATSQIDAGKEAYKSAKSWVTDRFNDASSWASTAYKDVSDWIGDRGAELDRWWNGYDVQSEGPGKSFDPNLGANRVNGFRDNATNWINDRANEVGTAATNAYNTASQWVTDRANEVGNAATNAYNTASQWVNDRGEDLSRIWNGYETKPTGSPEARERRQAGEVDYHPGLRQNIETAANNLWNDVSQIPGNIASGVNRFLNGYETVPTGSPEDRERRQAGEVDYHPGLIQNIETAANNVRTGAEQLVGNADRLLNGYDQEVTSRGVPAGLTNAYQQGTPDQTRVERAPGIVGRGITTLTDAFGNTRQAFVDEFGRVTGWVDNNIIDPVTGLYRLASNALAPAGAAAEKAANTIATTATNAANDAGQAIDSAQQTVRLNGDATSTNALSNGVSGSLVQDVNRSAVNGQLTGTQRSAALNLISNTVASGVTEGLVRRAWNDLQNGQIDFGTFVNRLSIYRDADSDTKNRWQKSYNN